MRNWNPPPTDPRLRAWLSYGLAAGATVAAAGVRWALDPVLGQAQPFLIFYVAILLVTFWLGWRPGVVATVLGFLIGDWFFLSPRRSFTIVTADAAAHTLAYFALAGVILFCLERSKRNAKALEAANESLRQSEERLRATFHKAAVGIVEVDSQDRFTAVNERVCQILDYRPEELLDKTVHGITSGEDRARSDQLNAELREGRRERIDYEKRYLKGDGSPLWVHVTASVVRDGPGRAARFIGTVEDISERKRAEESLRRAKEEWERTFDSVPDLIAIIDQKHRIQRVNQAMAQRLGVKPEQCVGLACYECVHGAACVPEYCPHALTLADGCSHSAEVHEPRLGGDFFVTTTPLRNEQGQLVGAVHVSRDITRRKQTEAALREQAQLAQLRADATQALQQAGSLQSLLQQVAVLLVERLEAAFARVWTLDAEGRTLELQASAGLCTHLDGPHSRVPVGGALKIGRIAQEQRALVTNHVLDDPHVPEQEWARREGLVAFAGLPLLLEGRLLGVAALFARHAFSPAAVEALQAVAGNLAQALGRKQVEAALQRSREELARANAELERKVQQRTAKLRESVEELEGFSYSLVHDLRAPLRAMQSFAGLAEQAQASGAPAELLDYLQRIERASTRMDQLVTDALNYSRVVLEELRLAPVEVAGLVRGILESYPHLQTPAADIRVDFTKLVVLGNEAALTQVFSNLLGNAVKFVSPGVKPCVRVWAEARYVERGSVEAVDREERRIEESLDNWIGGSGTTNRETSEQLSTNAAIYQSSDVVRIWVKDNGVGLPRGAGKKIFAMFQRMHQAEEYPGTGIGLAIVRKAMERMGGRVGVESEPGKGSRFWIELRKGEGVEGVKH